MEETTRKIGEQDYEEFIAESADRLRFQVELAQSAMRNLVLVNGGAIVALLTLIGNSSAEFSVRPIWFAFLWFSIGLSFGLLSYFSAFLSQYFYLKSTSAQAWNAQLVAHGEPAKYKVELDNRFGDWSVFSGLGAAALSLIFFVIGSFVALGGLL